jgi:hypothetical protein
MDEDRQGVPRRISRRRMGFAFSSNTLSDSTATDGDDAADVNNHVEAVASSPVASLPVPAQSTPQDRDDFNPRARMAQVRQRATVYEREYRLGLLHRVLMRRVPMDEIAESLGISMSQVYRDRSELKTQLRQSANELSIDELIGDSKGFYEENAAMAMRAASNANLPMPIRLAAVRTSLAAKNDMHRFFQTAGVYDVLRFKKAQDGSGVSDVRRLMEQTERILNGDGYSNPRNTGDDEEIEL